MAPLSLKIILDDGAVTRKVKFDSKLTVREAHSIVKDKVIVANPAREYALFLRSADNVLAGIWLENHRTLDYYMLRDGDSLDYICRIRNLKVKLLDGTVKTLQVDEAKTVSELLQDICGRFLIMNHDEYGLSPEEEIKPEDKKGKQQQADRDVTLETLSKTLHTDDNVVWLDQHRTLREQGIESNATLILKRRLFYSDRKVDSRDPVQLNLLYVQTRDAILSGHHLVTEEQAAEFAGIQCQIQFGDYQEDKHKPGFIENLAEFLPSTYMGSWGIERKLFKTHRKHQGLSPLEAKNTYIKTARELPTYGVTFFLVKEKQKGKMKLVPRLLGINAEAILRLDENTKEIIQQWPLTHVKTYHVGKSDTFTLKFGDWSDKEYSCKTQDVLRIRDILVGYIDLIQRRMLAKPQAESGDSMVIYQDNIQSGQSNIISHGSHQASKPFTETFVGPNVVVPFEQGASGKQGTQLMTVHQLIKTNQMNNPQNAKIGESGIRSADMSQDCVRKLKRMNSNSVKIVTLLTDPTEEHVKNTQEIVHNMTEDLAVVEMGVNETARQQTVEESKKMLLDEMQELRRFMSQLAGSTAPGHVDTSEAKDAAEKIASLTTEMYFAQDPKTISRGAILTRSKKSFLDGEKVDASLRRASFITATTSALAGLDHATQHVAQEYTGPAVDEAYALQLEKSLQDKIGRLNAALALYLIAHSDPNNIDYPSAINSMNTIHDITKSLPADAQMLASTKDPKTRKEMLDDMKTLLEGARKLCALTEADERDKMQEACNTYANVADKLLFTLARGKNVHTEDEIIELSREVGTKASQLLMSANALTSDSSLEPEAASAVDAAGVRTAAATRDLLACAQLTAPAIHEPHCQSAMTAACEGLTSSLHHLSNTWQPLVADPKRQQLGTELHQQEMDVHKAIERLQDAYSNLNCLDDDSLPLKEKQHLKFICSLAGAKKGLEDVQYKWDKPSATAVKDMAQIDAARDRLSKQMAQLNAAVAALAHATQDPNDQDYATAELALNTINELTPQIVKDMELVSRFQDEGTRAAMQQQVAALCEASKEMLTDLHEVNALGDSTAKYSAASSKLMFLISPDADKGMEKMMAKVAAQIYDNAAELASNIQPLRQRLNSEAAADLENKGSKLDTAARGLVTVAQVTAPSIDDARCASTLSSAVDSLRGCSNDVAAACHSHMKPGSTDHQQVQDCYHNLNKNLDYLAQLCQLDQLDNVDDTPAAKQERKRLQFINTMADAKKRLDAADQQMKRPVACTMMREEDAGKLERQLSDRMAQLNAAIADLARATRDRENPDYLAAQRAADTISQLMPLIMQETRALSGTKDGENQSRMLHQVQQLCDASRGICESAGQPQGMNEAAAKFGDASRNLVFCLNPPCDQGIEEKITDLSLAACSRAADLQSHAKKLAKSLPREKGAALEARAQATAAASQALLTTTKVTAPTIASPQCSAALVSSAEHLRDTAKELTAACSPHLTPGQQEAQQVQLCQQELDKSLDKLFEACQPTCNVEPGVSREQREKQRLQFINSLSATKGCFNDVHEQLKEPVICALMKESDGVALQSQLADRLAQLNAAVATLAVATADHDNPDYVSAQRAVKNINTLMSPIVQDALILSGTKDGEGQGLMLQQVQQLCDATKGICESAGEPQGLREAAAKFSNASNKLMSSVKPESGNRNQQEIVDLSAQSCGRASELLSHVQALTQQLDGDLATKLDLKGAGAADAAQNLLTVAQVAALSMSNPECRTALESAVQTLRDSAADLTAACDPHAKSTARQNITNSQKQLNDSLDVLLQACRQAEAGGLSPVQGEKQRLQFINSLSGARNGFDNAQQQLKQPVTSTVKEADSVVLQHQLSDRLAQLNAAMAALAVATADRDHPDYVSAQRALDTIHHLTPLLVQESRALSGTKDGEAQGRLVQQLQQLCDASRAVCESAGQPQGLREAAAKFSNASNQLMFTISPDKDHKKKQQVVELSAKSCGHATELLSQVQALTNQVGGDVASDLDRRGASTADAAQSLLAVAQMTSASLHSPQCRVALVSAVDTLRESAATLTEASNPHTQPAARKKLHNTQQQLNDSLDLILQACKEARRSGPATLSRDKREKQRLQFINSLSGARSCFDDARARLEQPPVRELLRQEDGVVLEEQLSDRVAQLNAAIAALAHATHDRDHSDYASAQRAVNTISALTPVLVQDAKSLSSTKDGEAQKTILRQVQELCDATKAICENAGEPQKLRQEAAKFGDVSSKLMFTVSPGYNHEKEKQIVDLSAASCLSASQLLSQVQALTQQVSGDVAGDLDALGAKSADAAQSLLTVAQVTAASISSPHCKAELERAVETLRGSAAEMAAACKPHVPSGAQQRQLEASQKQLENSLDLLLNACRDTPMGSDADAAGPARQEVQRVKFMRSVSTVSSHLDDAERHVKEPLVCSKMKMEDSLALQSQLTRRLAQLNAAVAALTSATTDYEKPDYPSAERAIITITELMPTVVKEAKKICCTKDDKCQEQLQQNVRELYEASRRICENADDAKKLNEAAIKFAVTSGQLVSLVGAEDQASAMASAQKVKGQQPAVPVRATRTVAHPISSRSSKTTADFLEALRAEESKDHAARVVSISEEDSRQAEEDKRAREQLVSALEAAHNQLTYADGALKLLNNKQATSSKIDPMEVIRKEQHMEDTLAKASIEVAALVSANYANKLDYKAAKEPVVALTRSVTSAIEDGSVISGALQEEERKKFIGDMMGLCDATKNICEASRNDTTKLNDSAITFGNQSAKLLRVVSADVDPDLEKEVISRAQAIGNSASCVALEASAVAMSTETASSPSRSAASAAQRICTDGALCVDSAGKLVYTAKLTAPTIHHSTCQDKVLSSAETLSTNLATFSETWKTLGANLDSKKLTEELKNLETLLEKLKADVKNGKFGKHKELDRMVVIDTPLRQLTCQIIENSKNIAEHGEVSAEDKNEYKKYSGKLAEALRALDLAYARFQRAPHDQNRRYEMNAAIADLQVLTLQSRPARVGQEHNNVVDFRDFLEDLVKEASHLTKAADKHQGAAGKRVTDDIKVLCTKINEDVPKLTNPTYRHEDDTSDDFTEIDKFAQECNLLVDELKAKIRSVPDHKARAALFAKLLPVAENLHLLRFATNSAQSTSQSASYEMALQDLDYFHSTVMKAIAKRGENKKTIKEQQSAAYCNHLSGAAQTRLLRSLRSSPQALGRHVTSCCMRVSAPRVMTQSQTDVSLPDRSVATLIHVGKKVRQHTDATSGQILNGISPEEVQHSDEVIKAVKLIDVSSTPLVKEEVLDELLIHRRPQAQGTRSQLEGQFHHLATKLNSQASNIFSTIKSRPSTSQNLNAMAETAIQLASSARGLKDEKNPVQCRKIEDAAHELSVATFSLIKTSELVCEEPDHYDARRKLKSAIQHLNDAINKLNRATHPELKVSRECGEHLRSLQLHESVLQAPPLPLSASPYTHCLDALHSQRDVLLKMNSEQAMSRAEFLQSMMFMSTAVGNSTDCAAQAAYLLSVSEKDKSIPLEGLVDVPKMHKNIEAIHDSCVTIVMSPSVQATEENKVMEKLIDELIKDVDDTIKKAKDHDVKKNLEQCKVDVNMSAKVLYSAIYENKPEEVIVDLTLALDEEVRYLGSILHHPSLVPTPGRLSADTQAQHDDVVEHSKGLVSATKVLINEVKMSPEQEMLKWSSYSKRREVLAAFDALLKSIKLNGQKASILEAVEDEQEDEKSYVQTQTETAFKWLHKPMAKSDIKANGQQAAKNLVDVGKNMSADLSGSEKEDLHHLIVETEQLLTQCSKRYDQEQYSLLMERLRELQKAIERVAVTRVVEDFMDTEQPLADLDILADAERDEKTRKFLLEKKIAELLAQLAGVKRAALFIADTGTGGRTISTKLKTCSEQTELLAPKLVKAAEERITNPDDKAAIEHYQALLAQYTESLSRIRELCDRAVDPMEFVQAAGDTMQRMREDSTTHNDPMKCALASAAITKLANRVIQVGLSSSTARRDPELQQALTAAQKQLSDATPSPGLRASKMPDWKDTTAQMLRATEEVEQVLGGETIFKQQPVDNQPIYNEALQLHEVTRGWSSRDNEIVAVAKRMAVLMAKLSSFMNTNKQHEVLTTSKAIVAESHEVARLAKKLAHECSDHRIKMNLLQLCERIPTISGQLKMLTTVKASSLGRQDSREDHEAMDMLVNNAQSLMSSTRDVVNAANSASVKIMSQRGPRMRWVRKTYY